ncbi:MAG: hypothetical protein K2G63_06950 [Oscillospiraceae bacterium]|nr:hypothetical protein [Oscillospiraceae bacterium]
MKKFAFITSLVLSVCTLCSFSACGDASEVIEKVQKNKVENSIEKMEDISKTFEKGSVSGNTYSSSFSNIKFESPDGWTFATDEELSQSMNEGVDVVGDDIGFKDAELNKKLIEKTTIYDMMASNEYTGENIIVLYENIKAYGLDPDEFSETDYINQVKKNLTTMNNDTLSYTQKGGIETVNMAGMDFTKTTFTAEIKGYDVSIEQIYYVHKTGDYMTGIILSSGISGNDMSIYEKCFTANE